MSNQVVIVVGTPGSGKSSIMEALAGSKKYKLFNLGTLMSDIGIKMGYIKHRDELRYTTNKVTTELRKKAAEYIAEQSGNIVIDTHVTVYQNGRIMAGLARAFLAQLKTTVGFVYVSADTDAIMRRRKKDETRIREQEDRRTIEMQKSVNIAVLSFYSADLNVPLYILENEDGKLKEAQTLFLKHIKDAFGE